MIRAWCGVEGGGCEVMRGPFRMCLLMMIVSHCTNPQLPNPPTSNLQPPTPNPHTRPEALIPVMKGSQHLVLVGDHEQLPPVVQSDAAKQGGLGKSLFERLLEAGAPSAMLQVQYRMHPSLSAFPNTQFYNGLLADGVKPHDRPAPRGFNLPSPHHNLMFVDVDGKEVASMRGSQSNEKVSRCLWG